MNPVQIEKSTPAGFGPINRQSVREFVGEYTARLQEASQAGENVHQLALDQQDTVDRMTAGWAEDDRLLFSRLYIEELDAYTNGVNDKVMQINAQTTEIHIKAAQDASNVATWISLIVFFGFIIFMINLMKS